MENRFIAAINNLATEMWGVSQYAKVEFNTLTDRIKKKGEDTVSNRSLLGITEVIYNSATELYKELEKVQASIGSNEV